MLIFNKNKNNNNNQYDYVNKSQFIVYARCVAEAVDPWHTNTWHCIYLQKFSINAD